MKKRVIISAVVAFVLLVAVIAAGLNAVFTVTLVDASFATFSDGGAASAAALEEKLSVFRGKSTTFLDLADVRALVAEYPCFRVDEVKKVYPARVELSVTERRETFACADGRGGYVVLDEEGIVLDTARSGIGNVQTGGDNILLENFTFEAKVGQVAEGDYIAELLSVISVFREEFGQIRANVRSVSLRIEASEDNRRANRFDVVMQEGVVIHVFNPSSLPAEKARAVADKYRALSDDEKLYGFIAAVDGGDGVIVNYDRVDYRD